MFFCGKIKTRYRVAARTSDTFVKLMPIPAQKYQVSAHLFTMASDIKITDISEGTGALAEPGKLSPFIIVGSSTGVMNSAVPTKMDRQFAS